jgi:hypothetical protein
VSQPHCPVCGKFVKRDEFVVMMERLSGETPNHECPEHDQDRTEDLIRELRPLVLVDVERLS